MKQLRPRGSDFVHRSSALGILFLSCLFTSCEPQRVATFDVQELTGAASDWPDGRYALPEISAGGVAVFDANSDGRLDVYHVRHPSPDQPGAAAPNALYLQQDDGKFVEASGALGLADPGYGNGVATADINGDGRQDVFVANLAEDALYLSDGPASYRKVPSSVSGLIGASWSSSAAFFDYDHDSDLDLWVTRYAVDDPSQVCRLGTSESRDYCGPKRYRSVVDTLWRNEGGGRFVDVSREVGLTVPRSSFGLVCADFNADGWTDVYVANDMQANQLFVNDTNGGFVDRAVDFQIAFNGNGQSEAGMGVSLGDVDRDGAPDLFLTHLIQQTNTLYLRTDAQGFQDRSGSSGLGAPSMERTGWGCAVFDLDLDGDDDAIVANGRIMRGQVLAGANEGPFWNDYAEPLQVFLGDGRGKFSEHVAAAGDVWAKPFVSRALAVADLDADGDLDLVVTTVTGKLRILNNRFPAANAHWLAFRVLEKGRDSMGAMVSIAFGGAKIARVISSSQSFQASSPAIAHFGLGDEKSVPEVSVVWPDGGREVFSVPHVDKRWTIERGQGLR